MSFNGDLKILREHLDGNLQVILFDLDGTLRHGLPSALHALLDKAVELGVPDHPEKRNRTARWTHYYWAQSPELMQDSRDYPEDELFWMNYTVRSLQAFDCSSQCAQDLAPEVARFMRDEFQNDDFVPPDVPQTLQVLNQAGFRLAVLSNRSQPCQDHLEQLNLSTYFELALVAGEVNSWKPDPQIFYHALERLGILPDGAIYIGDNYYADIVGAQRAGIQPVLIDPDGIFPDADCPVIKTIGDLQALVVA